MMATTFQGDGWSSGAGTEDEANTQRASAS